MEAQASHDYLSHASESSADPSALRSRAETLLKSRGASDYGDLDPAVVIHELQIHQIELEAQNNELRRAQEDLEFSRSQYFDLFDMAPIGYVVLDEKGMIRNANFAAATLLGMEKSELIGMPLRSWIAPESEKTYFEMRNNLNRIQSQEFEVLLKRSDATTYWARFLATPIARTDERQPALFRVALMDITSIKHAEEISRCNSENETLLLELQHRVKNTLNQILGFVRIQTSLSTNQVAKQALDDLGRRIHVLTNLYTMLYSNHDSKSVRLDKYMREIAWSLQSAIGDTGRVELKLDLADIVVDARDASSYGLVANELLNNAIKHGFPDARTGVISLSLREDGGAIVLQVQDDGIKLPQGFSAERSTGFGLKIVLGLAKQLHGEAFFENGSPKSFGIRVPLAT